ncbi:MAG: hypothetical protein AAF329_01340 [Cyanobacteria bacterium P01_A01_bin.17]
MPRLSKLGLLGAFLIGSALAMPRADAQDQIQRCDPIGRVAQGSGANFRRGQIICSATTLTELQDFEFLCFNSAAVIPLTGDSVVVNTETCSRQEPDQARERSCNRVGIARLLCFIPKGPNEQFLVIAPDARTISTRPAIEWEAVEDVTSYTVMMAGPGVGWERTVNANVTQLLYPSDEEPLAVGDAYEVIVVAHQDSEIYLASKVINVRGDETITLQPEQREPSRMGG